MARKKKHPEFELPAVVITALAEYLGTAVMNRMTANQAAELMEETVSFAGVVGRIVTPSPGGAQRKKPPAKSKKDAGVEAPGTVD